MHPRWVFHNHSPSFPRFSHEPNPRSVDPSPIRQAPPPMIPSFPNSSSRGYGLANALPVPPRNSSSGTELESRLSHDGEGDLFLDCDRDPRARERGSPRSSSSRFTRIFGAGDAELPPLLLFRDRECENGLAGVDMMLAAEERSSCGFRKFANADRFMAPERVPEYDM